MIRWGTVLMVLLFAVAPAITAQEKSHPTEMTTTAGKKYSGVKINKVEPDGVSIFHSGGVAKLKFEDLSPELQKHFGYDREKAAAFAKAEAARQAKLRAENERRRKIATLGSSVMKAEQKKNLIAQEVEAKKDAEYQRRFAQRMKVRLQIVRYDEENDGAIASYSKAKQVKENYMSGAIRRERTVIRWSQYSREFIFIRGLKKGTGERWEGIVMPDGGFVDDGSKIRPTAYQAYEVLESD